MLKGNNNIYTGIKVPNFHTFNIHWPHCTCHLQ